MLFTGEGKARAATFPAEEADVAERAAALMGLRVLRISTDEHRLVTATISRGRTFSGGKALVPFTKGQIVTQLNAFPEVFDPERPAEADLPPRHAEKAQGAGILGQLRVTSPVEAKRASAGRNRALATRRRR